MIRILINGQEPVNLPIGIDDLKENIRLIDELKFYTTEISGNLTFYGDDFETFLTQMRTDYDEFYTIEIQKNNHLVGTWQQIFKGFIVIADIEFDYDKRTVKCEIIDNNVVAEIVNNADIQIRYRSFSKLGDTIPLNTTSINVKSIDNVLTSNIPAMTIFDALDFAIQWLSNGSVTLDSDYLSTDTDVLSMYICTGESLRVTIAAQNKFPIISFKELWLDLHRLFHIYGYFVNTPNGQKFKVEPYAYFNGGTAFVNVPEQKGITATSLNKALISKITFGSFKNEREAVDDNGNVIDTSITWYVDAFNSFMNGWSKTDEIEIPIKTNTKSVLELRCTRLLTDINSISKILRNSSDTDYDEDIILTQDDASWQHIPYSVFDAVGSIWVAEYGYWNEPVKNQKVLQRWGDEICIGGNTNGLKKCEYEVNFESDTTNILIAPFPAITNSCPLILDIGNPGFVELIDIFSFIFDFEMYYIIENTTGFSVTVTIQNQAYPDLQTFTANPVYYNVVRYFTPLSTGWNAPFPNNADGLYNSVDVLLPAGQTIEYKATIENGLLYNTGFLYSFIQLNGATLKAGSYNRAIPKINKILDELNICDTYRYEVKSEGFIKDGLMGQIRNELFKDMLIPNAFNNINGKILSLERDIVTGNAKMTLKTKFI